jgi:hypothetical protein
MDDYIKERQKELEQYEKEDRALTKHLDTKIIITLDNFRSIFEDLSDNARLEVIKSLIWTAPNAYRMWELVKNKIANDEFGSKID